MQRRNKMQKYEKELAKGSNMFSQKECFEAYGLQKEKNWLKIPHNENVSSKFTIGWTRHERYEFMTEKLKRSGLSSCAIFAHAIDGSMCSVIKVTVGGKECFFTDEGDCYINPRAFKDVAEYFHIEKYALIIQVSIKEWKIVEE